MSEAEWLRQTEVRSMMSLAARRWLCTWCQNTGRHSAWSASDNCWHCQVRHLPLTVRKLRLIACGMCRCLGDELTGEPAWEAVRTAERFADGMASPAQLERAGERATAPAARAACLPLAWQAAFQAIDDAFARLARLHEARLSADLHAELTRVLVNAEARCGHLGRGAVKAARKTGERRIRQHFAEQLDQARAADGEALCAVLFDLIGNPFDPARVDPAWLEADGGRVRQVAAGIDREGCYDEMAVLADALQDAGCADPRWLDHCLQDRHWRGCWLIDALLGKG